MNLRRSMFHLYALLTTPPPLSTSYLALHLALISGYTVFLHAEGWFQANGLSAFVLACVFFMVLLAWRNLPLTVAVVPISCSAPRQGTIGVTVTLLFAALFLALNDPLVCQRAFSAICAFRVIYLTYGALQSPAGLNSMAWIGRTLNEGRENAALWSAAGCAALLAINEYAIAHWTLSEWIVMRSFAPIAIHALVWWSILATHEPDAR